MKLAGLAVILTLLSGIQTVFGAYVEPTQQEQTLYDQLKSDFEKLTISKKDVTDVTNSFSSPITFYFPCDQGETFSSVNATIQTKLAKFDPTIAHTGNAITGGMYVWKCSVTISDGKMTINCKNELMLNSVALSQQEKDPKVNNIENLVVYYHELLHGQLMIDAIKSSKSWQDHTCSTPIQQDLDYSYSDGDHKVITPLQTEFTKQLIENAGGFFKVEEITPDQTNTGSFSKKVGSLYDYPAYVKSGINISARSYNVADINILSQKTDIIISGVLDDKSKNGIVWLYVFGKDQSEKPITAQTTQTTPTTKPTQIIIPDWVKDLGKWWSDGTISDEEFVTGIKYLIEHDFITIPQTTQGHAKSQQIPYWVKNNAKWWSQGTISDSDFVSGLQYLIQNGIMQVQMPESDTPTIVSATPDDEPQVKKSGTVQINSPTFSKQPHQTIQAQITGKIDDFKTGTYVILTIVKPDGTSYDLKGILTSKGQYTIPIMIDSEWQTGKYTISARYNSALIGSTIFSIQ